MEICFNCRILCSIYCLKKCNVYTSSWSVNKICNYGSFLTFLILYQMTRPTLPRRHCFRQRTPSNLKDFIFANENLYKRTLKLETPLTLAAYIERAYKQAKTFFFITSGYLILKTKISYRTNCFILFICYRYNVSESCLSFSCKNIDIQLQKHERKPPTYLIFKGKFDKFHFFKNF